MMELLWLLAKDAFWSAIPAVGFAMLFNVPPRMLKYCAMGGALAHSLRTLLIHDYRRLLLRDPQLPAELLPAAWPGHEARALCKRLYQQLLAPSERHLDRHLQLATGTVPTASALLGERFGLSDPLRVWR